MKVETSIEQQLTSSKSGSSVFNFFKEPAPIEPIEDKKTVDKAYKHWRLRIFYSIFIGYVVFYLCKKNISAALPVMSAELGYSNTELGLIGSSLYLTYAFGKFINGLLADNSNVRKFLPTALIVSAVANICFALISFFIKPDAFTFLGMPSSVLLLWSLVFFWGVNGWFQSMGFPAIAKSLTFWFSNNERGTKWALWSCSHQTGTFLSVLISGALIGHFGWRAAFYAPAVFSIFISLFLIERLRDKPTSIGLPDIEEYREPHAQKCEKNESEENIGYGEIFKKHILCNKTLWLLALAYIFVYVIRFGTEDWMIKYLVEHKKNSLGIASYKLSFLPLFGIIGTVMAGFLSDKVFKGKRAPINIIYLVGIILAVLGLKYNADASNFLDKAFYAMTGKELISVIKTNGCNIMDFIYIGLIGLFTYGPQMLIGGLCAVESSSKKVAAAATGFTGSFGYLGAVLSGVGTGAIIDKFGWNGALYFWVASSIICIFLCTALWHDENNKCKQ